MASRRKKALILPESFYLDDDVVALAQKLLGMRLFTNIGGRITGGIIIETESYRAPEDRASHAYGGRRTKRTEVMYKKGGICYVYLCYGMHHLFNVITNVEGVPHAILIRALKPIFGIETMQERRGKQKALTEGPGTVSQALGINLSLNGEPLFGPKVWIEKGSVEGNIVASPRIGVDYAGPDALLPWRFQLI